MNTHVRVLPTATTPAGAFDLLLEVLKKGPIEEPNVTALARRVYSQEQDPDGFDELVKLLRATVRDHAGAIKGVDCFGSARFSLRI